MKSKFVRRPGGPSVWQLSLNLMALHGFLSIFEFLKKKPFFLRIFFVFVNMGRYGSEHFKTLLLQIAAESFPEFSS